VLGIGSVWVVGMWIFLFVPASTRMNSAANAKLVPRQRVRLIQMAGAWWLLAALAAGAVFANWSVVPLAGLALLAAAMGAGGSPWAWLAIALAGSWQWMLGNWAAIYRAGGLVPGDRIYFAFSFGPFLGFWTAFDAAAKCGFLGIPGGGLGSAARVRAMIQHQANVLCCTPTYALHLAQAAKEEDIDLRQAAVKKIIVAGETGGSVPEVRRRITEAWHGAQVLDHYGMTEIGPTAYQTPERSDLLHIIEDSYFAEIIRPETGEAVAPGEVGELVLTTLGRTACPLLRYRTGDLVRRAVQEPGFALAGGIIGRADDMVVVRGVNLYPAAFDSAVRLVPEISEYRVEISRRNTLTEVEVQIESPDDGAARKLERALTSTFSLRIPVTRVAEHTLPRFEMKARRWVWRE